MILLELLRVYAVYFLVLAGVFGLVLFMVWRLAGAGWSTIFDGKGDV